ncbi:hypothetical protein SAMN05444280_108150 [Tangfeifania diversioriginum]|uniref:Uncharacterized protein n=1 Tax=Tangfeifania diversioriginum TaxID=1168035 RepID=A0A1M6FFI9_9BACT|nr:hypothetical protein SAMN05444280_108150 [Tangfeifania diversioriginum]
MNNYCNQRDIFSLCLQTHTKITGILNDLLSMCAFWKFLFCSVVLLNTFLVIILILKIVRREIGVVVARLRNKSGISTTPQFLDRNI